MIRTEPPSATTRWTVGEIEVMVVGLLADLKGHTPAGMRQLLAAGGAGLPVDSLDLFDVLEEFRAQTGLRLPVKELKRDTLKSVSAFAEFALRESGNE